MGRSGIATRLFLTAWLVYGAHLTSNVARETYLAMSIGESLTFRVDPYLGLHDDLFEIPGRGSYINSNPGASMLGALPYALARPAIAALFRLKPALGQPKPPAGYDDPRPNRAKFMNEMRARGLDVKLALAAFAIQLGLMATLGAIAAVVLFRFLTHRLGDERKALWLALLYTFATPLFFRSAFLNQNAIVAHMVLFAWVGLGWPGPGDDSARVRRWLGAGVFLGIGLLCDYSTVPLAFVFGCWAIWEGWAAGGLRAAARRSIAYIAGTAGPVALLLWYQWSAFGSPWFPAQRYMPATEYSVLGWKGFTLPTFDLLWRNLFDPRFGLFVFCPMLVLAFAAPFLRRTRDALTGREVTIALAGVGALWLFSSANQFANLQWNTGVRYMVPAVPLLFFLLVPVLGVLPRWVSGIAIGASLLVSWATAMTREDPLIAVRMVFTEGPTLPMLIVLRKTAAAYAPFLQTGVQPAGIIAVLVLALTVWAVWRIGRGTSSAA